MTARQETRHAPVLSTKQFRRSFVVLAEGHGSVQFLILVTVHAHGLESQLTTTRRDGPVDPALPLVTIITPTYNQASYLPETIESILTQDYPNLEYLILNDGSTDDTQAVLQRYEDSIRTTYHPNMGVSRTINRGLELARGDIIGLVSSDDPLLPQALSTIVQMFQENPDVLLVYPDWNVVDEHGEFQYHVRTPDYAYVDMVRYHHTYPGPCSLFRRSMVERIGGYDTTLRFVPDYDFYLRAGLLGPFRRVPKTLATYRSHSSTLTRSNRGVDMAREHIEVMDRFFARTDLPPEVLDVKLEAYRNTYYVCAYVCQDNLPSNERFEIIDKLWIHPEDETTTTESETRQPDVDAAGMPSIDTATLLADVTPPEVR